MDFFNRSFFPPSKKYFGCANVHNDPNPPSCRGSSESAEWACRPQAPSRSLGNEIFLRTSVWNGGSSLPKQWILELTSSNSHSFREPCAGSNWMETPGAALGFLPSFPGSLGCSPRALQTHGSHSGHQTTQATTLRACPGGLQEIFVPHKSTEQGIQPRVRGWRARKGLAGLQALGTFSRVLCIPPDLSKHSALPDVTLAASCFSGDDFSLIQQEIYMVKECKHCNIVAYFGSYLR